MSTPEQLNQSTTENEPWCPKCGAARNVNESARGETGPDVPRCDACGTPLAAAPSDGGYGELAKPPAQPQGSGRNPLTLLFVAIVAAIMLYFGFHMARRSASDSSSPPLVLKNTPAPDFTLESLDGRNLKLSDLRGKAVLLNFWATWCGPCKIETPWLVELQKQYGSQGLQVVGIAMDDSGKDEISKFARDMGMNYPVLLGKEAVGDAYGGVPALPESFFIGRDGKIVDRIIGLKGRGEIEDSVKKALSTSANSAPATAALVSPR